ncbi:MAG: hypothetical protein II393_01865 [Cytophagales bacterium]|nr:hypothetical protein [Cytophagales bacterium]
MFCKSNYLLLVIGVLTFNFTGFGKNCCPCGKKEKEDFIKVQSEKVYLPIRTCSIGNFLNEVVQKTNQQGIKEYYTNICKDLSKEHASKYLNEAFSLATGACNVCTLEGDENAKELSFVYMAPFFSIYLNNEDVNQEKIDFVTGILSTQKMIICDSHSKCSEKDCKTEIAYLLSCGHFLCETHFCNYLEVNDKKLFVCPRCWEVRCSVCADKDKTHVVSSDKENVKYFYCPKANIKIYCEETKEKV